MGEGAEREGGECGRRKRIGAMEQDEEEDVGEGAERGAGCGSRRRPWEEQEEGRAGHRAREEELCV